ncbi:MAG: methyltransferase domain-containing protein [bacterium]|nr:methyltransferase domain-containing protein [bacterium]
MSSRNHYIHGSSEIEQDRLAKLNDLLNKRYLSEIAPVMCSRVLDIGAGLGHLTRLFKSRSTADSIVIGIELDANQLAQARELSINHQGIEFRQGDAQNLELPEKEWGSFDYVHSRFVLEHVQNPSVVVTSMASAASSGGKVVIADDDHSSLKITPGIEGFDRLWDAYIQSYINFGNDPYVGSKLVSLLVKAELKPIKNGFSFFGACQGMEEFDGHVNNLIGIIEGAIEPILETGISLDEFKGTITRIKEWSGLPDAAIWYPIFYAIGQKP